VICFDEVSKGSGDPEHEEKEPEDVVEMVVV